MHNLTMVKKLVDELLEGDLIQLKYKYVSDNKYEITIRYSNQWDYSCEYRIVANEVDETSSFCYHICNCQFQRIKLLQEETFEKELMSVLRRQIIQSNIKTKHERTT